MDFRSLPTDTKSLLALQWTDYEPYYTDLENRNLNAGNIEEWLNDWSTLAQTADEQYWRLYIATTLNTADPAIEEAFNNYIEGLQASVKTAEQKLKDKAEDGFIIFGFIV